MSPSALDSCWSSPADQAGQVDNLMSRIERIERILAQLGLSDVRANQLQDISPSVGTVTDMQAIASNIAGGWTTDGTFTGVAFSTLGWPFAGGEYPIVTMVDGVLQYGFDRNGAVTGSKVGAQMIGSGVVDGNPVIATGEQTHAITLSSGTLTATSTGNYLACFSAGLQINTNTVDAEVRLLLNATSVGSANIPANFMSDDWQFSGGVVLGMTAGQTIQFRTAANNLGSGSYVDFATIWMIRLA